MLNQQQINCQLINLACRECLAEDYTIALYVYAKDSLNGVVLTKDVVSVSVKYRDEPWQFVGVIVSIDQSKYQQNFYQLCLCPTFSLLKDCNNQRAFVSQTVLQIMQRVVQPYSCVNIMYSKLNKQYKPLVCEVQYQESDYDFLKRLMSENGIGYYYDNMCVVLYDDISGYKSYNNQLSNIILWRRQARYGVEQLQLISSEVEQVCLRQLKYDLVRTRELTVKHNPHKLNQRLVYAFQREQQQVESIFVVSDHIGLAVGATFLYRSYFVVSEIYHFLFFDHNELCYSNQFYCHAASQMLQLPFYSIPAQAVSMPAEVSGIESGRLLRAAVRYQWDQNNTVSPMVPVRQYWSGDGYGAQFMPQLKQKVLVKYINGDMRCPIIMGAQVSLSSNFTIGTAKHYMAFCEDGLFFKTSGRYKAEVGDAFLLKVHDDFQIKSGGNSVLSLQADDAICLSGYAAIKFVVGDSFLKIEAGKIILNSAMIEFNP